MLKVASSLPFDLNGKSARYDSRSNKWSGHERIQIKLKTGMADAPLI
jgi:hypothetical protein